MNASNGCGGVMAAAGVMALAVSAVTAQAPTERTLKALKVELREGKGPAYKVVAVAKQGETVRVLEQDPKSWVLLQRDVASGAQKGWVHVKALEASATKPGEGEFGKALTGSNSAEISAAAAAKGIEPQTQIYASTKGWNTDGLREIKRRRESVTYDEFAAFIAALKGR